VCVCVCVCVCVSVCVSVCVIAFFSLFTLSGLTLNKSSSNNINRKFFLSYLDFNNVSTKTLFILHTRFSETFWLDVRYKGF